MANLLLVAAAASAIWGAGDGGNAIPSKPEVTLAQADAQADLCVGPDCRYFDRYSGDWRYLHGDNWRYYRNGTCRDVTIREERGGEVVIRHVRRCE